MTKGRITFIYILALIMFIFGVIGFLTCFGGMFVVKKFYLGNLNFTTLNSSVQEGVGSVNVLIKDSSTALANVSTTVREAKDTLLTVSELSESAAGATFEIAKSMDFEILTFKPLEDTIKYFREIGNSLESFSVSIEDTAKTIDKNADDIEKISADMETISLKIDKASESFDATTASLPDFGFKKILYILLAYAGILHLMFVLTGVALMSINKSGNP
jgi:hypothetical protein